MYRKLLLLTVGWIFSTIVLSQQIDTAKLNNYFNVLAKNSKVMGSVAVAKKGELIYRNSIGYTNVEQKVKADEKTTYGIGSISKTFTATLMLKAVEEGKIRLSDKLVKYFPSIKNAETITFEQLLQHRSGIPNFTNDTTFFNWNEQEKTREDMIVFIANSGSDFAPGSISQYSNSNYVLLSYILEDLYGKPFSEILKEKITAPLDLKNTYIPDLKKPLKQESNSYKYMEKWEINGKTHPSITLGAGGIFSTPTDLVKFSYSLFSGKIIKQESLDSMVQFNENYGFGLFPIPFYEMKGYGHTGGIDGYNSVFAFFPHDSLSYAFIANGNNYKINDISIAVLSTVYGLEYKIPVFSTYEVDPKNLHNYVGAYSSEQIPLEITIRNENNNLIAQASGQPSFPLTPKEKNVFVFDPVGVEMIFNPEGKSFVLKQSGQEYIFKLKD